MAWSGLAWSGLAWPGLPLPRLASPFASEWADRVPRVSVLSHRVGRLRFQSEQTEFQEQAELATEWGPTVPQTEQTEFPEWAD